MRPLPFCRLLPVFNNLSNAADGSGMFGCLHLRCLQSVHETGIFNALYHISAVGVFLIAFCSIKTDRSKRSRWFVCRCVSPWASPPKIQGYFGLPPFASQLHLCSVYLRCLSVPFTSSVYSVLPDMLILPAALERTAEPWESVDTFLSESAALNFQRNVWADIRNWTSSGQQFICAFCTNSHAYWDNCDCVRRVLTFLLPMWIITGSLRCHLPPVTKKSPLRAIKSSGLRRLKSNCLQSVGSFSCLMINNTTLVCTYCETLGPSPAVVWWMISWEIT